MSAVRRWLVWTLLALGLGSTLWALWVATGLSTGCDSPFLGRYIGGKGDPAATSAYACLQAAPHRRTVTLVLECVGLAVLAAACLVSLYLRRKDRAGPATLGVGVVGLVGVAALLATTSWAVARVPIAPTPSTPTTAPQLTLPT